MSLVSFVRIKQTEFAEAINNSLNLINYKFPSDVKNIVIKPNLCYYWDCSTGKTTDPAFIGALVDVLRQRVKPNPRISIVESDASAMKCKHVFKILGYEKLAEKYAVELINLSEDRAEVEQVKVGKYQFSFSVPHVIQNADLRINVPKLKYTAERLGITCALKNLYGCNPYPKKSKYHSKIEEAIVAINKLMKFNLSILDGNIAFGVRTIKLGLVMASQDPVAFDVAAAKIAGLNPNKLEYIKLATREALGTPGFTASGMPMSYFMASYPRKDSSMIVKNKAMKFLRRAGLSSLLGF